MSRSIVEHVSTLGRAVVICPAYDAAFFLPHLVAINSQYRHRGYNSGQKAQIVQRSPNQWLATFFCSTKQNNVTSLVETNFTIDSFISQVQFIPMETT